MQLKGKSVFITGGTGGIGRPLVALLQQSGANVRIYERGRDGDLIENIDRVCAYLKKDTPDILINMAGYSVLDYFENQDIEPIIALNMSIPMRLIQAVLPQMKARNSGHIVNVGSMTALIPLPHLTAYVAAKAGIKACSDALRRELGETNIHVLHILPRAVATPMNAGIKADVNAATKVTEDAPEDIAKRIYESIIAQKAEVRIGWPERLFAIINSIFPRIVDKGLQKNTQIGEVLLHQNQKHKTHQENGHEEITHSIRRTAH